MASMKHRDSGSKDEASCGADSNFPSETDDQAVPDDPMSNGISSPKPRRQAMSERVPEMLGVQTDRRRVQGQRPGDKYVRVVRHQSGRFSQAGPGHLVATDRAFEARGTLARRFQRAKRVVIGSPIASAQEHEQRLTKVKALAVFSSDALSSVAYATEEIMKVLILAGAGALSLTLPISIVIVTLLVVVVISYRQTIAAYPSGGGSYIVASDNLGELPGLTAAASLLTDYVLTVSVSIAAGILALTSLEPALLTYKVELALGAVVLITVANLRGIRESGSIFAIPTYAFVVLMLSLIGVGLYKVFSGDLNYVAPETAIPTGSRSVALFLLLSAFAQGCTAMTGTEAISNGVPAFKKPEPQNARTTLVAMGLLLGVMFIGLSFLAQHIGIRPAEESVLSQVGRTIFGRGPIWVVLQFATALILVLAANTAFADFPRLASILARDGYLPRAFRSRGDRLAFSVGIIALAIMASALLVIFAGSLDHLIPLYAVGVFTSFTLSQSGMVIHWKRLNGTYLSHAGIVNGGGAIATGIVTMVIAATKFTHGACIVLILIPLLIVLFKAIRGHYDRSDLELAAYTPLDAREIEHVIVVPIAATNRIARHTLAYARSLSPNVTAIHVANDDEEIAAMRESWEALGSDVQLVIIESPYRSVLPPFLRYLDEIERANPRSTITVVLPEFVAHHWWEQVLHNQTALRMKASLLFRTNTVVISVPYHLERSSSVFEDANPSFEHKT